eukprot:COSAG03_NODE_2470_length_2724_cov_2.685714_3_plen_56_part_00
MLGLAAVSLLLLGPSCVRQGNPISSGRACHVPGAFSTLSLSLHCQICQFGIGILY